MHVQRFSDNGGKMKKLFGMLTAAALTLSLAGCSSKSPASGGVHGSNRLGGNAVADFTVFGLIAGESAAAYAK
jgi:succinate dehydrogenase/fumarate reductase flavoprotein subunit